MKFVVLKHTVMQGQCSITPASQIMATSDSLDRIRGYFKTIVALAVNEALNDKEHFWSFDDVDLSDEDAVIEAGFDVDEELNPQIDEWVQRGWVAAICFKGEADLVQEFITYEILDTENVENKGE
ncbi:hypothetical protein [Butyrivibrio sp.]|uniref:hypothetical protein n=1 Tax=Butyrivibrio sp. TaxID=28121 RepID=UPI0025C727BA|nr:hypothetical protein [Butyrivibrio sp.]MBQ7428374.1 hypothetical protein [Butyrivibrio sp.]MBQ9303306.1 hypothetical protein [Butyrivibrio sp.]